MIKNNNDGAYVMGLNTIIFIYIYVYIYIYKLK